MMRDDERQRYARHLMLEGLDADSYESIRKGRVLVIGAGGLGSPALYYLAAAGVGTLGVVDNDRVEISNLQRQILHTTADLGRLKTGSAYERLCALNPDVCVAPYTEEFGLHNAEKIISGFDVVITAVDNLAARYAANDACVRQGKVLVEAAVNHFSGQAMSIRGGVTACYRCLFPVAPPDGRIPYVADKGIFGPVAGVMGAIQAAEALKILAGVGEPLFDRILSVDVRDMSFTTTPVERDRSCPVCGAIAR